MNQFIRFPIQIINSGIIEFMEKSHLRVYMCLDSHKNSSWQSFPSLATIQKEIHMCLPIVQAAIKDLVTWGLILKAHRKREKGRGYRTIYTIIREPAIKIPHKRVKEKILLTKKRKRDLKGRFTDQKHPSQSSVLKPQKQPSELEVLKKKKSKHPSDLVATTYPSRMVSTTYPSELDSNQSLTSINQYKKNHVQNNSIKEKKPKPKPKSKSLTECVNLKPKKPKLDTSEKAWRKEIDNLIAEKMDTKSERDDR